MPPHESQFEADLYQLRRDKLAQIAALVRSQSPGLTDAEAKYPNTFRFTHTIPVLRSLGDPLDPEALAAAPIEAAIAGRLMAIRVQGKAGFAQLQQGGQHLQLYIRKDDVGSSAEQSQALFDLYKLLDLGDHIGVRGHLMRTRTGELTLHVSPISLPGHEGAPAITLLTKAMLALPDKYSGLEDIETRYRQRYVDLIVNSRDAEATTPGAAGPDSRTREEPPQPPTETTETPNVRSTFVKRAAILRALRKFFDDRGYLEVETPMLHTIAGGAAARPFKTHHNALDIPLSLRIAPELYLKRLVVGGLDRVYEINRNFRNEGVSTQHNPEFTMLEFYQAYANYHDLMDLTQELITYVSQEVNGTTLTTFNGVEIDLSKWTKLSMREAIQRYWVEDLYGPIPTSEAFLTASNFIAVLEQSLVQLESLLISLTPEIPAEERAEIAHAIASDDQGTLASIRLRQELRQKTQQSFDVFTYAVEMLQEGGLLGKAIADIFEYVAEHRLIQPTIIYDFPLAVSPLSKIKPDEPDWVERFEFYIGGFEVGNAFSELNDPDDQHRRFQSQLEERERGDEEAMAEIDEDYVRALGIGLPPTAGEGIGIDRLTMILTGSRSIRDVILFPLMRPHAKSLAEREEQESPGESAE